MVESILLLWSFFFFNDTATTEIYTLSLHDALPISETSPAVQNVRRRLCGLIVCDSPATAHNVRNRAAAAAGVDRKSTRLNSSHANISYAVFCLKKKTHHAVQQVRNTALTSQSRRAG